MVGIKAKLFLRVNRLVPEDLALDLVCLLGEEPKAVSVFSVFTQTYHGEEKDSVHPGR